MVMEKAASELIQVKVTTRASSNRITTEGMPDGSILYRIYVTIVPENGKANDAVIRLLAEQFHLSKSSFDIIKGRTSRNKTIRITP
jgi:uncharacterized protein YggU (UPF0235/DUF167 family)